MFERLLQLIFPKDIKCIVCKKELNTDTAFSLCTNCENSLKYSDENRCRVCNDMTINEQQICTSCMLQAPYFKKAITVFDYTGLAKQLLIDLKYNNKKYLLPYLTKFMLKSLSKYSISFDYITFVPSKISNNHNNVSELLAKQIATTLGVPCLDLLIKTTAVEFKKLDANQRKMYKSCFEFKRNAAIKTTALNIKSKHKNILLIDDVITTKTTANACSKKLLGLYDNVYVLALCRTRSDV